MKAKDNMTREEAIVKVHELFDVPDGIINKKELEEDYRRYREINYGEQEPKNGHWIYHKKGISTGFLEMRECSFCHCYFEWEMLRNSFCPNCGCRMESEE